MLRSLSGFGRLGRIGPFSRRSRRGGLVAGLAIGMPDTLRAACGGSQTLGMIVACFGWEAITTPELSGMLPNSMQKETTVPRTRTSYLENRFTGESHLKTGGGCAQAPQYRFLRFGRTVLKESFTATREANPFDITVNLYRFPQSLQTKYPSDVT